MLKKKKSLSAFTKVNLKESATDDNLVRIKVVGIGGCGIGVVNRMVRMENSRSGRLDGVEYIAMDADAKTMKTSLADVNVQIDKYKFKTKKKLESKVSKKDRKFLKAIFKDADLVFIIAGMGGNTGTGFALIVADITKKLGILTVGVATKPFGCETDSVAGESKSIRERAQYGIEEFCRHTDMSVVIPQDNLHEYALYMSSGYKVVWHDAPSRADWFISSFIRDTIDAIKLRGLINTDIDDFESIAKDAGCAHICLAFGNSESKAEDLANEIIQNSRLDNSYSKASRIGICITASDDIDSSLISGVLDMLCDAKSPESKFVFSVATGETMKNAVRFTVIATGFESEKGR